MLRLYYHDPCAPTLMCQDPHSLCHGARCLGTEETSMALYSEANCSCYMPSKAKFARYALLSLVCYQLMTDSRQTTSVAFVHVNRFVSDGTILHRGRTKAVAGRSRRPLPLQEADPYCGRCRISRDLLEPLSSATELPESSTRKVREFLYVCLNIRH